MSLTKGQVRAALQFCTKALPMLYRIQALQESELPVPEQLEADVRFNIHETYQFLNGRHPEPGNVIELTDRQAKQALDGLRKMIVKGCPETSIANHTDYPSDVEPPRNAS